MIRIILTVNPIHVNNKKMQIFIPRRTSFPSLVNINLSTHDGPERHARLKHFTRIGKLMMQQTRNVSLWSDQWSFVY